MLISPGLAARLLGISYPTLRRWILAGRIAARRTLGGRYLIPDGEIFRLLASDQLWLSVVRAQSLPRRIKLSDAIGRGVDVPLLERIGLAAEYNGRVIFRECLDQPVRIIEKLLPSLLSLKYGVGFRGDVEVARREVRGFITLDYAAYELTGYQLPRTLYLYPDELEDGKRRLRKLGFKPSSVSEADVVLLPNFGSIDRYRIHLDSLAKGGRSTLDALAIELLRPEIVAVEARYPAEMVRKVVDDLRAMKYGREIAEVGGSEDS